MWNWEIAVSKSFLQPSVVMKTVANFLCFCLLVQVGNNDLVANIEPCNHDLILKQCLSLNFSQSIYPIMCSNSAVSESEIHIFSLTEVQISCGNLCCLIGGYTKQSNKNRICSNNWSSCNACI